MGEISDRAKKQMMDVMSRSGKDPLYTWEAVAEAILSIPEIAIVDREAELPENPYSRTASDRIMGRNIESERKHTLYKEAQQDMLKAGWVKEVPKDA